MINTLETSMIFIVCIPNSVVSSMFLQRIINDSPMDQQWQINDSDVNTTKKRSQKFHSQFSMFQQCPSKASSTNHQGSSTETSRFPSLMQKNYLSLLFASKSSKSHQRLSKEPSKAINQSSSNETSKIEKQRIKSFIDQKGLRPNIRNVIIGSSKSHQRIINEEAMKHHWFRC